jgi:cytochrome b subunit of formate dehydrogenase
MSRNQRAQHALLFTSFAVLVLTGFALKFPDSWFGYLLFGMGENLRRIIHRIAGTVLIGVGIYHLCYAAFTRDGRRMLRDIWFLARDAADALGNLRYYLGAGVPKPEFGRFTYAEKAEYWALVWGSIVMAVTGIMLWAKVAVGNLLPRWWLDVATAIHFYEAVLATLAIVVWHFYQVFFDPDTYPMNWAWWDGQMPLEHYRSEHPLDLESVMEAGHAELSVEKAPPDQASAQAEHARAPENEKSKGGE